MYNLVIVGAGQLGSRHLQGLARLPLLCQIYVVDPSIKSLELARLRLNEIPKSSTIKKVNFFTSMDSLPELIDYAVISTTADVRLSAISNLLVGRAVRYMLLEKVLFQCEDEYRRALNIFICNNVRAWVNCPRRVFPIYKDVKQYFNYEHIKKIQVVGGGWGLGCNAIHFIDLIGMLTERAPTTILGDCLDDVIHSSKRKGFKEFTGSLYGSYEDTSFELTCLSQSSARLLITIMSESKTFILDESEGKAYFFDEKLQKQWREKSFSMPFLSEFSTDIVLNILTNGNCQLTDFETSISYHLPMLEVFRGHAAKISGIPMTRCPIT